MPRLWITFKDEKGEEHRIAVDRSPFTVGRHSECDLTVLDSRLSREHLRIASDSGKFTAQDIGSSNGTTINGSALSGPTELRDGDKLDLGGGLEIFVELEAVEQPPDDVSTSAADVRSETAQPEPAWQPPAAGPIPAQSNGGGIPIAFFIIGPLLGLFVLAGVIGAVVLFGGGGRDAVQDSNEIDDPYPEDRPSNRRKDEPDDPKPKRPATPFVTDSPLGPTTPSLPGDSRPGPAAPGSTSETQKVEQFGAAFVRQIAANDPKAFLTGEQAARVGAKVKQVGRSSAIADNLNSLRKNTAAIKALAAERSLPPHFLGIAAVTRLGSTRGDVLQAARAVADVYSVLRIQIGNENFDEALLMVAAYDQAAAGETMKMRNMLQSLAQQPGSPGSREIRSIWYLQRLGKITEAEYDRALTFLAVGTIAQNPKDFGVNAEALRL